MRRRKDNRIMNTPVPPGRPVAKPHSKPSRSQEKPLSRTPAQEGAPSKSSKPHREEIPRSASAQEGAESKPSKPVGTPKAPRPKASEGAPGGEVGPKPRGLTLLGAKSTVYSDRYTPAVLEAFENRHPGNDFFVKFNCPEFTSLCPVTGQPDFATLYISYIPDKKIVESKSLKLYLFGFRNHGAFHEDCVNMILEDLVRLLAPRYIEVWGKFLPRGGLSIDPYANYGKPSTRWEEFARQRLLMHDLSPERVDNR